MILDAHQCAIKKVARCPTNPFRVCVDCSALTLRAQPHNLKKRQIADSCCQARHRKKQRPQLCPSLLAWRSAYGTLVVLQRHHLSRRALHNGSHIVLNIHAASARCNDVLGRCLLLFLVADPLGVMDGLACFFFLPKVFFLSSPPFFAFQYFSPQLCIYVLSAFFVCVRRNGASCPALRAVSATMGKRGPRPAATARARKPRCFAVALGGPAPANGDLPREGAGG